MEIWLRTNVRAVLFGTVLPLAVGLCGLVLLWGLPGHEPAVWMRGMGGALVLLSLATILALLAQLWRPRLAYRDGQLLVRLRSGSPIRVPIEVVECFWLGQAPSLLPGKRNDKTEAASVVIRIAESATEWRHQDVKPQLGSWCEGYVTIRGTWCEPLNVTLVQRLNERLAAVTHVSTSKQTAP